MSELTAPVAPPAGTAPVVFKQRRGIELVLILVAQSLGWGGYILTGLNRDNAFPAHWLPVTIAWFGVGVALHLVVRWRTPYADPVLLPCVFALVGIGQAALYRFTLDFDKVSEGGRFSERSQIIALFLGLAGCCAILIWLRNLRRLNAYPYVLSAAAVVLLLLPLVPGLGWEVNGSRIWIHLGPFSLQPAEIAKLVLAASFAGYLTENRELLASGGRRLLGFRLTRVRDIAPLLVMWGVSLVIIVGQRDLGTALLFFGLIVLMLYVSTGQLRWIVIAAGLGLGGSLAAWRLFGHVQQRVAYWLHPEDFPDGAYQIITAQYGMSVGGLAGAGWGLGWPYMTPYYFNDMIAPSLVEEIGVAGLMGIVVIYGLIAFRGLRMALQAKDPFTKLFAAGLSFGFLLQTFAIIGGSTRLLPLTGLTCPFLSQGGSSMIANWLLAGLLLVTSHEVRRPVDLVEVDLADERTMTIDVRQLRHLFSGQAAPLLDVPADLVKEDDAAAGPERDETIALPPPGGLS
ncbi:MAG: FtsW/RodA/SpoVE family cell cycle protein [Propionibacteriaceae bacterium]|jgi:cell division protein FtsW (lipid II flippase)|nr:FtsW/RodA/SpoVE family cell cycle protein [Propionibacteriaceae bacterium]